MSLRRSSRSTAARRAKAEEEEVVFVAQKRTRRAPASVSPSPPARPELKWKRMVRFLPYGRIHISDYALGEPHDPDIDIGATDFEQQTVTMKDFWTWDLNALDDCKEDPYKGDEDYAISELLPIFLEDLMCGQPVFMPERVYCVGVNYRSFATAAGLEIPQEPTAILRPTTALEYHGEDIIVPKGFATADVDYEAHLAVVIGQDCKNISPEHAINVVFGILAATHIVLRNDPGRTFDGCCTLGPVLVNADALQDEDWSKIEIEGELNGEIVQKGFVSEMAFSIPQLISSLSRGNTLKEGTIILTGTPGGTGWYKEPRRVLKDGDKFRVWVSHGVGSLVNTIKFEK